MKFRYAVASAARQDTSRSRDAGGSAAAVFGLVVADTFPVWAVWLAISSNGEPDASENGLVLFGVAPKASEAGVAPKAKEKGEAAVDGLEEGGVTSPN